MRSDPVAIRVRNPPHSNMMLDDLLGPEFDEETRSMRMEARERRAELLKELKEVEHDLNRLKELRRYQWGRRPLRHDVQQLARSRKIHNEIRERHGYSTYQEEKLKKKWKLIQWKRGYDV